MTKKTKNISIYELVPNMILSKDVQRGGVILANKGTKLTTNVIEKLVQLSIDETVEIYEDNNKNLKENNFKSKTIEEVEDTFKDFSSDIQGIFSDIGSDNKINIEEIRKFTKKILSEFNINDIGNIIKNIVLNGSGEDCIFRHSINVTVLSIMLGKWLQLEENEINLLGYAAVLHDFGKTKIDKNILLKPSKLTKEEFNIIKKHPVIAYNDIKDIPYLNESVSLGILMHHERNDGSGYPLGLKDDKIHKFAKIIAIADIFDAINSDRCYRKGKGPFMALRTLKKDYIGKLDYTYINVFLQHIINYYIGENVLLNTGEIAKIIKIDINHISTPLLLGKEKFIDLKKENDLYIEKIII